MSVDATKRQNRASHPESSTWVSANAGSGKTRVLTDRVARLLLTGNEPQKILCLTYTKAAAAEMQNRLFRRLGEWAMLPEDELRGALTRIGERGDYYDDRALAKTRTHFARALETPGGLKIQTIHAFCANLLRRFPLEAGVSPQFREMDEGEAGLLRASILEDMAGASDAGAFDGMARHLTNEDSINGLLLEVLKNKDTLETFDKDALAHALSVSSNMSISNVQSEAMDNIKSYLNQALVDYLKASTTKKEAKAGEALEAAFLNPPQHALERLETGFLTKDRVPQKAGVWSAATRDKHTAYKEALEKITDIITDARQKVLALRSLARAEDLQRFSQEFITRYENAKSARNLLDFDDLIGRTKGLLSTREMTDWVLYKIDNGIDHILVDEAQDTSPSQWEIIQALSEDFTSGQSASTANRTIFVVGDKKQSIFGFQGADPEEFSNKQGYFSERLSQSRKRLDLIELPTSFRSAAPILQLVDTVFADDAGALGGAPTHNALEATPGRIDLWPFLEPAEKSEKPAWWEPVDTMAATNPVLLLAEKIASHISDSISQKTLIHTKNGSRPLIPGDFLILVRSRSRFFHVLIDKLKAKGIPVAGADRMKIGEQLAVRDLLSVVKFLDNELDDLSLAEALRSPIFGLTEGELFELAHDRKGTLWESLRKSDHKDAVVRLTDLRRTSDFIRPYDLLNRLLIGQGARRNLIARLGAECEDAIDELLAQSILFEASHAPTLGGFLNWLSIQEIEIKRDMEAGRNEVRVMTVHGAKGLEAPVVILPDVTKFEPATKKPPLARLAGQMVWTQSKTDEPKVLLDLEEERKEREAREYARLLYVALTRAENWLIIAGAGQRVNTKVRWYNRIEAAFTKLDAESGENDIKSLTHRWVGEADLMAEAAESPTELPHWIAEKPKPVEASIRPVSPSGFDGPHALPGEITEDGTVRGNAIHSLLETLPGTDPDRWNAIAKGVCGQSLDADEILSEVAAIIHNKAFELIFNPDTLVEVPVTATLPELGGKTISGRIDRLIVTAHKVLAIDFKSNSIVPKSALEVPKAILAQQGAYAAALSQIYPDLEIETAIIWTKTGELMNLPHSHVNEALRSATVA